MGISIRDFVYLDVERLKSIMAQVEEGLAETQVQSSGRTQEARGGIEGGIFGVVKGATEAKALWQNQVAETRSLHDYIYNKVESALLEHSLISRIPGDTGSENATSIRERLTDTSFFLATGRVSINDFSQMRLILDNFNEVGRFIAMTQVEGIANPKKRDQAIREKQQQGLSLDKAYVKGFGVMFDTFYKDRIVIKLVPLAADTSFRLVGNLSKEFLRDAIEGITYKYGTSPTSSWTMFGQIAAIPPKEGWNPLTLVGGAQIESAFQNLFDKMRQLEMQVQCVVHPEIAVTPIAVYRESPK